MSFRLNILRLAIVTISARIVLGVSTAAQAPQVFHAETAAIPVSVSVVDGRRVVAGLTVDDFVLTDNGVRQTLTSTTLENIPIDLTLVVDASGSLDRKTLDQFKKDIGALAGMLTTDDQFRLVLFAATAVDVFGWQPGGGALPPGPIAGGGSTGFYQTLAAVLARRAQPGRRHLVVAMTDGFDNISLLDENDVEHMANTGDAVVHIVLRESEPGNGTLAWGWTPFTGPGNTEQLRKAAEATGGRLRQVKADASLLDEFRTAINEFRTSYLLWYTPKGVDRSGWHTIDVEVKNGRYTVRARRGWDGGLRP